MAAKYVNTTDIISNMWLWEICGMESLNKYYTKWWKVMKSVFQKCLRKDFGKHEYKRYVALSRRELKGQKPNELSFVNKPVYQRMYRHLMAESADRHCHRRGLFCSAENSWLRAGQHLGRVCDDGPAAQRAVQKGVAADAGRVDPGACGAVCHLRYVPEGPSAQRNPFRPVGLI